MYVDLQSFQLVYVYAQEREFVVKTTIPIFSEFCHSEQSLTPYLVDLPGSNEACQQKLANVAKLNVETATSFLYVMTYTELRNDQDFETIKAIYNRDKSKLLMHIQCHGNVLLFNVFLTNKYMNPSNLIVIALSVIDHTLWNGVVLLGHACWSINGQKLFYPILVYFLH